MIIQILLNTIISGIILSLVALGFGIIFKATKVFHIAHGGLYVIAVYSFSYFRNMMEDVFSVGVVLILSLLLALIIIKVIIIGIEFFVYKPLYIRSISPEISLISSLGVYFVLVNLITFFFGNEGIILKDEISFFMTNEWITITNSEFIIFIVGISLIALTMLFDRSSSGVDINAISDSYLVAMNYGINVQNTRYIALLFGTFLVGLAGILKGYEVAFEPNVGMAITLTAAVAVIIGGVYSLKGIVFSCFILATIENFSVLIIPQSWVETLTYLVLLFVILFFDNGLISNKMRVETR